MVVGTDGLIRKGKKQLMPASYSQNAAKSDALDQLTPCAFSITTRSTAPRWNVPLRFVWSCLALVWMCQVLQAASPAENRAFNAAANSFTLSFWERAEAEFGDFVQKFPTSTRLPEAILYQAEARLELTNYTGAIDLLKNNIVNAGLRADQYQFWLAEAFFRKGEFAAAADAFAKLIKDFPNSPTRLEAGIDEASARAKLADWPRVTQLLSQSDSVFQAAVQAGLTNELVIRGYLMLGEGFFAQNDFQAAEKALAPLSRFSLPARFGWQMAYLLCRIQLAQSQPDSALAALAGTSNLLAYATQSGQPQLQAESYAFRADILERLGRIDEALLVYTNNLSASFPAERQREAFLRIARLLLARNQLAEAAQMLEKFSSQYPQHTNADLALLTLGELRLRQHLASAPLGAETTTNVTAQTNYLQQALAAFNTLTNNFGQSAYLGKAQLNLGWVYWLLPGKLTNSHDAFFIAARRLPFSTEQAIAHFKLADTQFELKEFGRAVTNYLKVADHFSGLAEVKTNLAERALYQAVRAAIAAGDREQATNALGKIIAWFPSGFHTERAVLLEGQQENRLGNGARARQIYESFLKLVPDAPLRPEVELAIARTYEQENHWESAAKGYESWLERFTNSSAYPRAEYACGWANFQAGAKLEALRHFTNLVARFPTNEFAPSAQLWVGDYFFGTGNFVKAEETYQLIEHNWPGSKLAYQALMMAIRTAFARQGLKDAQDYFFKIWTNCPTTLSDIRAQALFAYGDILMSMGTDAGATNRAANYQNAIIVFNNVIQNFPNTPQAVLALGQKAMCLLQWEQSSHQYGETTKSFNQVLNHELANPTARSIAKVGLGIVLEKEAALRSPGAEQTALLNGALTNYVDVFFPTPQVVREGEKPDLFWTEKAGLEAARLAASLQQWEKAINIYRKLGELLPPLKPRFEKYISRAEEQLKSGKIE